ncbi:hypothetical protein GGR57DRAFT_487819 [Xylariaceae sp. FL1272]|nr:hypothetical protein GGR57DRAFT_487819 [Xylariaceae sp. FL1272]
MSPLSFVVVVALALVLGLMNLRLPVLTSVSKKLLQSLGLRRTERRLTTVVVAILLLVAVLELLLRNP